MRYFLEDFLKTCKGVWVWPSKAPEHMRNFQEPLNLPGEAKTHSLSRSGLLGWLTGMRMLLWINGHKEVMCPQSPHTPTVRLSGKGKACWFGVCSCNANLDPVSPNFRHRRFTFMKTYYPPHLKKEKQVGTVKDKVISRAST